jgi:sporulation protein YlmC with PRC-barrel domain
LEQSIFANVIPARNNFSFEPNTKEQKMLRKFAIAAVVVTAAASAAYAQQPQQGSTTSGAATPMAARTMTALPSNTSTVTNWYKQNVYNSSDAKIGSISDVLVNREGKVEAFIVAVGGFLGMGEKDVAVPFDAIHATERDGKWWLTMNATKDGLKSAAGYKFDKAKATWVPV